MSSFREARVILFYFSIGSQIMCRLLGCLWCLRIKDAAGLGAKRIYLSTLVLIQYLDPSGMLWFPCCHIFVDWLNQCAIWNFVDIER